MHKLKNCSQNPITLDADIVIAPSQEMLWKQPLSMRIKRLISAGALRSQKVTEEDYTTYNYITPDDIKTTQDNWIAAARRVNAEHKSALTKNAANKPKTKTAADKDKKESTVQK